MAEAPQKRVVPGFKLGRWSFFSCLLLSEQCLQRSHAQCYTCTHRTSSSGGRDCVGPLTAENLKWWWCAISPIPNLLAGGFALVFQVVENGKGKQFAMKRIMVNNEFDLKLAKQEIAVMVREGRRMEGRGEEGKGGEGRGGEWRRGGERIEPCQLHALGCHATVGLIRGGQLMSASVGSTHTKCHHTSCDVRLGCTEGVSLVLLYREHLPTTATRSPSTTGPLTARVTIFTRSSL